VTTQRFRIVEWTSEYTDGSRKVVYELLKQTGKNSASWKPLGTSSTLEGACKALLFHAPNSDCWSS
jgi:hypothetical protein